MHYLSAPAATLTVIIYSTISAATLMYSRPALLNAQLALQITSRLNDTNNVIPGGSPFFYMDDPAKDLFSVASISMTPTPCQIGLPCSLEARGTFHEDLKSIELDLDLEARLKDGQSAKLLAAKDDLCDWVTLQQGSRANCPPQNGPATISLSLDLAPGWIMEATYFLDVKLMSGDQLLTHVGARMTLTDPDKIAGSPDTATS